MAQKRSLLLKFPLKIVKAMKWAVQGWACRGRGLPSPREGDEVSSSGLGVPGRGLRASQPSTLADEGDEGCEGDEVSSSGVRASLRSYASIAGGVVVVVWEGGSGGGGGRGEGEGRLVWLDWPSGVHLFENSPIFPK